MGEKGAVALGAVLAETPIQRYGILPCYKQKLDREDLRNFNSFLFYEFSSNATLHADLFRIQEFISLDKYLLPAPQFSLVFPLPNEFSPLAPQIFYPLPSAPHIYKALQIEKSYLSSKKSNGGGRGREGTYPKLMEIVERYFHLA